MPLLPAVFIAFILPHSVVFALPAVPIVFVVALAPTPFSVAESYDHHKGSVAFLPALPFVETSELLVHPVHQVQLDADWPGSKLSLKLQLVSTPPPAVVLIFHLHVVVILFDDK